MNKRWQYNVSGIDDGLFIRGDVPMTKSEVRAVTLNKLKLLEGLKVLDIGAGTGSVSVECALKVQKVTSIERNPEGVDLIKQNAKAFDLANIEVIEGSVPEAFIDERYHRVFIGGSGGKLPEIFDYLEDHLLPTGVIVGNTITIENTSKIMALLKKYQYTDIEAIQVNVSRSRAVGPIHMMIAENPITIISGRKS